MYRRFGIFAITFVVVVAGGIAFAQIGEYLPSADDAPTGIGVIDPGSIFYTGDTQPDTTTTEAPDEKPETTKTTKAAEEASSAEETPAPEKETTKTPEKEEVADTDPPDLIITSPVNEAVVTTRELRFSGSVEPGATVKAAGYRAEVTPDGFWSIVLMLEPGGNLATIKAFDEAGNVSEATVKVFYEAPEGEHAFSATQQYKTSASNPPYDVFYGTGRPGTTIAASSDFGSGSTTVNEKGKWEMKVTFPTAPYYEWFAVDITDSDGHSKTFEFKSKYNPDATYEFTITQKYHQNTEQWEKFTGTAAPGTVIGAYSDFGSAETIAEGGEFYLKVHFEGLKSGQTVDIVVETSAGDRREFTFVYAPAPIEFSVTQKYASCSENPPYDVFYGTATPGATVWAESPYGLVSTIAGDLGKWDLKVIFEGALPGPAFNVTIGDSEGHSETFTFTVLEAK